MQDESSLVRKQSIYCVSTLLLLLLHWYVIFHDGILPNREDLV